MNRTLRVLPAARADTLACFEYLREHSGLAQAWHFLDCLADSFDRIQQMPFIGVQRQFRQKRLRTLRQWPVKEFADYLIFYKVTNNRIDINRILHGRRDLTAVLTKGS